MGSVLQDADDYVLGRGIMPRIRLNLQHFMYRKIFGYTLHPSIPREEGLKIADVATGTGIWMLDLMSELPATTTYHGFDIDLSQVPPKEWTPHNISFSTFDLHKDLPEELEEAFDIINIRLLVLVVRDNDPTPILRNMFRMLKPGGWLQWSEGSHHGVLNFLKAQPHLEGSAMKQMRMKMASHSDQRFQPTWQLDLPAGFGKVGFGNVQQDRKDSVDCLPWMAFITDTITALYQEFVNKMPPGPERDEFQQLYYQAAHESMTGTAWNGPRITVVGQKPKERIAALENMSQMDAST